MPIGEVVFYVLSLLAIVCALGTIFSRNPISSILYLILTFFCISGHYVLLNAQFLAIVNIIVYAGAIMVLFLFVVMLLNLNGDTEPQKNRLIQLAGVISGGIFLIIILAALKQTVIPNTPLESVNIGLIKNLGRKLFTDYVIPFDLSSVLFLSAIIGSVYLSAKPKKSKATK